MLRFTPGPYVSLRFAISKKYFPSLFLFDTAYFSVLVVYKYWNMQGVRVSSIMLHKYVADMEPRVGQLKSGLL